MTQVVRRLLCIPLLFAFGISPGKATEADAIAISNNIQAHHFVFGTVMDPMFASATSDQIVGYTRCGDSAIWTGHYLAAESFRYQVTRSADALNNVKKALAGLKSLVDVTGNNVLARCLIPQNSPYAQGIQAEEQHNGIYNNNLAGYYWVGNTSRDQYSGAIFGLAVAYDMVDDPGVRSSVSDLTTRMVDFLRGHDWNVVMPNGSIATTFFGRADQQLTFLQVGRHVNSDHYSTTYDVNKVLLATAVIVPIGLETTSNSSYFKFNLDTINLYNLVRLESSSFKSVYQSAYDLLRKHTDDQQNAFFNMVDRALNGPNPTRDGQTVQMLNDWLLRPRRDVYVDLRGKLPSCNNPDEACNPIPVAQRVTTDFLWQRSPYQLDGGGNGTIESAGIDYILPYWMARYYNVIGADTNTAVSAADGSANLAPESLAAFYGANLSNGTQSASGSQLPLSLAGTSAQVKDSAGVSRPAPLFYVSPAQVDFEVPPGTAVGTATVTITSSASTNPISTNVNIQPVAPSLFTADSSGHGVAAAVAVRSVIATGQQSSSLIFQCSGGSCASLPIALGVDTPVYLTLYGTGIRNRSALSNVTVTIHGTKVPVQYAGPQGQYAGLDQVNISIPLSLRGSGETDLVLTVDGKTANTVRVNIQ